MADLKLTSNKRSRRFDSAEAGFAQDDRPFLMGTLGTERQRREKES
jgi:hypothetical protein